MQISSSEIKQAKAQLNAELDDLISSLKNKDTEIKNLKTELANLKTLAAKESSKNKKK